MIDNGDSLSSVIRVNLLQIWNWKPGSWEQKWKENSKIDLLSDFNPFTSDEEGGEKEGVGM